MEKIKLSAIIKIADKAREIAKSGERVIRLDTGEPHFITPKRAIDGAVKALNNELTHYSHSRGIEELRNKLCELYNEKYSLNLTSGENIIITPGAKQAIFYTALALIDRDDEVIIPSPGWVSYEEIVRMADGIPVFAEARQEEGFTVKFETIKEKITLKTKAIFLNSPNNPTGKVIDYENLKKIYELCLEKDIWLVADEIYDEIIFKEGAFTSILSVAGGLKNIIYINGFSKTYAMTGWRLGYIIALPELIGAVLKIQQNSITCPTTFIQHGAVTALGQEKEFIKSSVDFYGQNKKRLLEALSQMDKFSAIEPDGGLYLLINVSKINASSYDFCLELLDKCRVSAIPGIAFGQNCEGFIRICLATEKENIDEFIKRLKDAYC